MKLKILYIAAITYLLGIAACQTLDNLDKIPDPKVKYSSTFPFDGEYFVQKSSYDSTTNAWKILIKYKKIVISGTASGSADSIWFDDLGYAKTKAKITISQGTKSFTPGTFNSSLTRAILKTDAAVDIFQKANPILFSKKQVDKDTKLDSILVQGYPRTVRVVSGQLLMGAAVVPSKTKTDSINIELIWSDDAGTKYRYSGVRRTGFLEDEH